MAFTIIDAFGPVISAKISGELGRSEVNQIQAAALDAIRRCGKISALFILENFIGWKQESGWGDITFLTEHDQDIAKIAVVGEDQWRDLVYAFLAKGFRQAAIEYFLPGDLAKARAWLGGGTPK
ncbi:MAG TPA: STAS/SEC14 domain-containing protein [Candidatus Binatia bacterium]|nr:STAS/SEC14 domain-containing protein [Candidatus Binatia bacterium]